MLYKITENTERTFKAHKSREGDNAIAKGDTNTTGWTRTLKLRNTSLKTKQMKNEVKQTQSKK